MARMLCVVVLREDSPPLLTLLSSSRISLASSSTVVDPPSNQQIALLLQENVHMQYDNTGKIELEGVLLFYRVTAPLCMACLTEQGFEMSKAIEFLSSVLGAIQEDTKWSTMVLTGSPSQTHAQLETALSQLIMAENSRQNPQSTKMSELQNQVDQVKSVMTNNVQMILERGDRLENMQERSEQLAATSESFKTTSRRVQRKFCMLNAKWTIISIIGFIVLLAVVILIILSSAGVFKGKTP